MRSLLLDDALPTSVELSGRTYPIAHDFREVIKFETLMLDDDVPDRIKRSLAVRLFFGKMPSAPLNEVIECIIDFYHCGKPQVDIDTSGKPLYSFVFDWDFIYAGFLQAYGIDLLDSSVKIHWFKFRAMLAALPEDSQFMRVVGYRGARITSEMPKETREHLRHMKELYALPQVEVQRRITTEEELQAFLQEIREEKAAARELEEACVP